MARSKYRKPLKYLNQTSVTRNRRTNNYKNNRYMTAYKVGRFAWKHRKTIAETYKKVKKAYSGNKQTRRLKQSLQGTSQHNDTSTRYFRCVIRKGRKGVIQKLMNQKHHFKFTEDWQAVVVSGEGRQGCYTLKCIGTKDQFIGSGTTTTNLRNSVTGTARNYFEMNPFKANTGSVIFPATASTGLMSNDKIYYKSIYGTLKILNMTSAAAHFTVYWLMCKRDTFYAPEGTWAQAIQDESMGTTVAAPTGLTTVATATPGAPLNVNIGQNPFQYRLFKKYWKVLHKKVYYLQGGDQVDNNFHFEYNKLLDRTVFDQAVDNPPGSERAVFLANYSIVPFVICYGALVGIMDSGTVASEVTPAACKVGFYINQTHEFGPVPAELRTPTAQYFPGAVEGTHAAPRQIDDTDEADVIKVA